MSFCSDEVNFLIYQYLQESGFHHSAYSFASESNVLQSKFKISQIATASLINIIQKGFEYFKVEFSLDNHGNVLKQLPEKFSLFDAAKTAVVESENNVQMNNNQALIVDSNLEVSSPLIEMPQPDVRMLRGHTAEAYVCAWNPIVDYLATGFSDSTVRIWNLFSNNNDQNQIIVNHYPELNYLEEMSGKRIVTALDWNCNGSKLAIGCYNGMIRIWEKDGSITKTLKRHKGAVFSLKWNQNGNYFLSGGVDQSVRIWKADLTFMQVFQLHSGPIFDIVWKSNYTFASCSADGCIYVCKKSKKETVKKFLGHTNEVNSIAWDPQGNRLVSCSDDFTLKIWTVKQEKWVQNINAHSNKIYTVKWSPTGPGSKNPNRNLIIASGSLDTKVRLWDVASSSCVHTLEKHTKAIYSIAFRPDGKFLASAGADKFIHVWSVDSGQLDRSFMARGTIFDISWNSSSDYIAVSVFDGCVSVLRFT